MNRAERRRIVRDMRGTLALLEEDRKRAGCDCIPRLVELIDGAVCARCGWDMGEPGGVFATHVPPELGLGVGSFKATCPNGHPVPLNVVVLA